MTNKSEYFKFGKFYELNRTSVRDILFVATNIHSSETRDYNARIYEKI